MSDCGTTARSVGVHETSLKSSFNGAMGKESMDLRADFQSAGIFQELGRGVRQGKLW